MDDTVADATPVHNQLLDAAEALRRERDLVRTIAENSTHGLVMMDERGYCTYANRALLEMTGYSAEEIRSKPLHDLIHHHYPDGRPYPKDECPIDRALPENSDVRAHEDLFFRKDGSSFPVLCAASPIFEDGRPVSTVIEIRDVTAEKAGETALRQSEQRFRNLADMIPQFVWSTRPDGYHEYFNERWYEYTGMPRPHEPGGQDQGWSWSDYLHPDDVASSMRQWKNSIESAEPYEVHYRFRRASDGAYRWFIGRALPIRDTDGYVIRWFGTCTDIEDQRREEEKLEHLVTERTGRLQEQAERLRLLASALSSAEQRERKRLAALLHDDLQQMLYAVQIRLQLALSLFGTEAGRTYVVEADEQLRQSIAAARSLTSQLRPPALYEAGLVPALEWLASDMARRHSLHVTVEAGPISQSLSDDVRALLFDSVRELLFNVIKHAGVDAARVEAREDAGRIRIVVSDEGHGFDPGRANQEAQSGFGLFSVRERIAALDGSFNVEAGPGEGTRIELAVPVGHAPSPPAEADPETLPGELWTREVVGTSGGGGTRSAEPPVAAPISVVLVDDHALVRYGLASVISSDARMNVIGEASDGIEALDLLATVRPQVVLIDVNMPRMNGIEATREIVARWPDISVIGLSMMDDDATTREMLSAGAVAHLPKAGAAHEMLDTIARVAAGKAVVPTPESG